MQLGVEHLVGYLAHVEHLAQQLGDFHRCRTNQTGTAGVAHLLYLVDYGTILLAVGLVHTVVHIVAGDGLVGGNLHHIQLVDVPELACLGRGGTRHTGQLVVHAEIVLQRDGGKGLCGCLHAHMLLGFDGLMQTVAPAAALHDTACLLVHNLHLAIHDHILVVLVEHGVGLEQLLQGMYALALHAIVCQQVVFLVHTLLICESGLALKGRQLRCDVGQHKEGVVFHLLGQPCATLVGKVGTVEFLVHYKVERSHGLGHAAVVVLHIDFLGLLQARLDAFFREEFDECLILRQGLV